MQIFILKALHVDKAMIENGWVFPCQMNFHVYVQATFCVHETCRQGFTLWLKKGHTHMVLKDGAYCAVDTLG